MRKARFKVISLLPEYTKVSFVDRVDGIGLWKLKVKGKSNWYRLKGVYKLVDFNKHGFEASYPFHKYKRVK